MGLSPVALIPTYRDAAHIHTILGFDCIRPFGLSSLPSDALFRH